jgi:hypothetical protein
MVEWSSKPNRRRITAMTKFEEGLERLKKKYPTSPAPDPSLRPKITVTSLDEMLAYIRSEKEKNKSPVQ